jgi:uncharacterized membrane protein YesL
MLEVVANLFLLNLLWMLTCLPIVTIFPATAAMFGVVRQWQLYKDSSFLRLFFQYFKENFKQSFQIGIVWLVITSLIYSSYKLIGGSFYSILSTILLIIVLLFTFTTIFIFPIMIHYKENWCSLLKNSLLISLTNIPVSLVILVGLVGMMIILWLLPITCLFIFSVGAYGVFALSYRVFRKVDFRQISPTISAK